MDKQGLLLLSELAKQDSYEPILGSCYGKILTKEQLAATVFSLIIKKNIISFDTGLGKTVIASALINLVLEKEGRALFILKRTTMEELYKKIKESCKKSIRCGNITNEQSVIDKMICKRKADTCNLLVISSDSLANNEVNNYLYGVRNSLTIVIVDEMHLFSNLTSVESRLMDKLMNKSEYSFALTATPFQRDIIQLINTGYMLNNNVFGGKKPREMYNVFTEYRDGKVTGYKNLEMLKKIMSKIMFNVTREMLNIEVDKKCKIHLVRGKEEWRNKRGNEAFRMIKADTESQPYYKLCELLTTHVGAGRKGLVYINLNEIKSVIFEKLKLLGFRVDIVDGTISNKKDRERTKERYRRGDIDVLIINTVASLDLEGDFVIFYELTLQYTQMIGRLCRTYEDKQIFIDFIIAEGTYEETFFKNNVYSKVKLLSEICDKDSRELTLAVEELNK